MLLGLHRVPVDRASTTIARRRAVRGAGRVRAASASPVPAPPVGDGRPPRRRPCRRWTACAGWPVTSTPTPCTPTARTPSPSSPRSRLAAGWTSSPSPTTTRSATTPSCRGRPAARHRLLSRAGGDHRPRARERVRRHRLGRLPAAGRRLGRARSPRRGGLLSINHPLGGDCCLAAAADRAAPPLAEIWHSGWLDRTLGRARSPGGAPGGPDVDPDRRQRLPRPGADALPGAPTTWVLDRRRRRPRRAASRPDRRLRRADAPLLLRCGDELLALDADGALLSGFDQPPPGGPRRRFRAPAAGGPVWLEDDHLQVLAALRLIPGPPRVRRGSCTVAISHGPRGTRTSPSRPRAGRPAARASRTASPARAPHPRQGNTAWAGRVHSATTRTSSQPSRRRSDVSTTPGPSSAGAVGRRPRDPPAPRRRAGRGPPRSRPRPGGGTAPRPATRAASSQPRRGAGRRAAVRGPEALGLGVGSWGPAGSLRWGWTLRLR